MFTDLVNQAQYLTFNIQSRLVNEKDHLKISQWCFLQERLKTLVKQFKVM